MSGGRERIMYEKNKYTYFEIIILKTAKKMIFCSLFSNLYFWTKIFVLEIINIFNNMMDYKNTL